MYMITEQVSLQIDLFFAAQLSWYRALIGNNFQIRTGLYRLTFKCLQLAEAKMKIATLLLE